MENLVLGSAFSINILFVVINLIVLFYLYSFNKKLMKESERVSLSAARSLEKANQKSEDIVMKAVEKSKKILVETEYLKQGFVNELNDSLKEALVKSVSELKGQSKHLDSAYARLLEKIQKEHAKKSDEAFKSAESLAEQELNDFRNILKKETIAAESAVEKKIQDQFERTKEDIKEYKQKKYDEIEEKVKLAIVSVTEDVLGKALPVSEHEKLIFEALEQAKSEGMFE